MGSEGFIIDTELGAVAQLGERQAGSLKVVGSNPTGSTSLFYVHF